MLPRMMLLISMLCAAVLAASPAFAQQLYNLPAGSYLITGDVRAVGPVISPNGPVVPPVDPVVPPQSDLAKAITAAIGQIPVSDKRHEQAMKLAAVISLVETKVGDGTLPPASAGQAVNLLAKAALGNASKDMLESLMGMLDAGQMGSLLEKAGGAYDTWSTVISLVESELSKQQDKAGAVKVLETAGAAIQSTVPASGDSDTKATAYGFDWDTFLAFLMKLMEILLPLIIS